MRRNPRHDPLRPPPVLRQHVPRRSTRPTGTHLARLGHTEAALNGTLNSVAKVRAPPPQRRPKRSRHQQRCLLGAKGQRQPSLHRRGIPSTPQLSPIPPQPPPDRGKGATAPPLPPTAATFAGSKPSPPNSARLPSARVARRQPDHLYRRNSNTYLRPNRSPWHLDVGSSHPGAGPSLPPLVLALKIPPRLPSHR
jgi:hypothetical protein